MLESVLIAASKSPAFADDQDGGSILIRQLVRHAPAWANAVDLMLFRAADPAMVVPAGIRNMGFLRTGTMHEDKFAARLDGWQPFVDHLNAVGECYELIVITHVSNAFGLWNVRESVRRRILLYPMFTGLSYRLAGEWVPDAYLDMEQRALAACPRILTPSTTEKSQLVEGYRVDAKRIEVIPRGIDHTVFAGRHRTLAKQKSINLICIGAIRPQKNTTEAIRLVSELRRRNVDARLHLAGALSSPAYVAECRDLAAQLHVVAQVHFHSVLTQRALVALMDQCDLAVSVSRWETFGRGIFEGLTMGLPTLVFEQLACVWEYVTRGTGILSTAGNAAAMAETLAHVVSSPALYSELSRQALDASATLEESEIMPHVHHAWSRAGMRTTMEVALP